MARDGTKCLNQLEANKANIKHGMGINMSPW